MGGMGFCLPRQPFGDFSSFRFGDDDVRKIRDKTAMAFTEEFASDLSALGTDALAPRRRKPTGVASLSQIGRITPRYLRVVPLFPTVPDSPS